MTSIKPPTRPASTPGAEDVSGPGASTPAEAPRETFRETLDATRKPPSAEPLQGVASITDDLRAGRIDARTAVDRLVARALAAPDATALPPAGRAELEAHLRAALSEDPTLVALAKDLERAR